MKTTKTNARIGNYESKRITVKAAMALLKEDGYVVTEEQAKSILDFMYDMAEILVEQYLEDIKNSNPDNNSINHL